tara:strand:+ start:497 stop:808 length:312 start_codon:yes stop_codon:yes gene_type:complete
MRDKQKVDQLTEELNCAQTISRGPNPSVGRYLDVVIDAPAGSVFCETETHFVLGSNWGDHTHPTADIWQGLRSDLEAGIKPCEEKDCEICAENLKTQRELGLS